MPIHHNFGGDLFEIVYKHIDELVRNAFRDEIEKFKIELDKPVVSDTEFITAEQAAVYMKRKLNTIYKDVRLGKIPHYRSGPRKLLFSKTELDYYIKGMRVSSKHEIEQKILHHISSNRIIKK